MHALLQRIAVAAIVMSVPPLVAAERERVTSWPHWRGAADNGAAAGGRYASGWQDAGAIAWKLALPGIGCSTPIVARERILVTCPVDGRNALLACDWQGKELWRAALGPERAGKHRNGSGSNPSPVTDGETIFVYFKSGELAAVDFEGRVLWQTNLQDRFAKDTLYWDIGTSPVLTTKAVVVSVMHSGESYLAAFDKRTGDLAWKVARNYKTPVEGDHSYATPLVIERDGRQEIVVWGAEHLTGHDAADGRLRWSCGGFNPESKGNWVAVASPVIVGGLAIVPYGRGSHVAAVGLDGQGDVTATHRRWTRDGVGGFVPSPVAVEDRLYFVQDGGEVVCLEAASGRTIWSDRLPKHRMKYYSSPLVADGKLYAAREDGVVFVADVTDGFRLLSENDMGERVIASPVAVDGRLLIRGENHLVCIGK